MHSKHLSLVFNARTTKANNSNIDNGEGVCRTEDQSEWELLEEQDYAKKHEKVKREHPSQLRVLPEESSTN